GITIDVVGDAVLADDAAPVLPAGGQFLAAETLQRLYETAPVRPRLGWSGRHLIEDAGRHGELLEQILWNRCDFLNRRVAHSVRRKSNPDRQARAIMPALGPG